MQQSILLSASTTTLDPRSEPYHPRGNTLAFPTILRDGSIALMPPSIGDSAASTENSSVSATFAAYSADLAVSDSYLSSAQTSWFYAPRPLYYLCALWRRCASRLGRAC